MEINNVMCEDPRDFVLNDVKPCIVISDYALSEGYECSSVITFYGNMDSGPIHRATRVLQQSNTNLKSRSVANLIVFEDSPSF